MRLVTSTLPELICAGVFLLGTGALLLKSVSHRLLATSFNVAWSLTTAS
jgi:hypothetical protein